MDTFDTGTDRSDDGIGRPFAFLDARLPLMVGLRSAGLGWAALGEGPDGIGGAADVSIVRASFFLPPNALDTVAEKLLDLARMNPPVFEPSLLAAGAAAAFCVEALPTDCARGDTGGCDGPAMGDGACRDETDGLGRGENGGCRAT